MGLLYTAVHGQDSLILFCRTKVSEILHWFIHQALAPPHLRSPAYYQKSSVTRNITLLKIHDKVSANCIARYILQCAGMPYKWTFWKRRQCYIQEA